MRRTMLTLTLSLFVLVVAGCGSSSSTGSEGGGQKTIAGVKANDHGTRDVEDNGKTEIELDDDYFEPTVLEGEPGQTVRLELKNEGEAGHTFTIDSQNVDQEVEPGDEAEVDVTIPESGVVSFYCKFHKSAGMAGALAVKGGTGGMTGTGGGTTNEDEDEDDGGYDDY